MRKAIPLLVVLVLMAATAFAQDIREAARKAIEDQEATLRQAQETEARILADRGALTAAHGRNPRSTRPRAEGKKVPAEMTRLWLGGMPVLWLQLSHH